jgi:predicted GH43/DUF377 family glycosyl hydrolase
VKQAAPCLAESMHDPGNVFFAEDELRVFEAGQGPRPLRPTGASSMSIVAAARPCTGSCTGAALHDLNDPSIVLGVADNWILQPEDPWEISGYVNNDVFCCGAVAEDDGSMKIYSGGRIRCHTREPP